MISLINLLSANAVPIIKIVLLNLCFAYTEGDFSRQLCTEILIGRSKIPLAKIDYNFLLNVRDALGGYFFFFGDHQIKNHAAPGKVPYGF